MINLTQTEKDFIQANSVDDSQSGGNWGRYHSADGNTYVKDTGNDYRMTNYGTLVGTFKTKGEALDAYVTVMLARYKKELDSLRAIDGTTKTESEMSPINEDIISEPEGESEAQIDSLALSTIKRELYDMLIECSVGANQRVQMMKIQKMLDRLADAWGVDISKIQEELDLGFEIEKEHSEDNQCLRYVIALQHIVEDVSYYTNSKPDEWAEQELEKEEAEDANEIPLEKQEEFYRIMGNPPKTLEQ